MKKVSFIGAGNMATAIIKGMISGTPCSGNDIFAYDVMENKAACLADSGIHACFIWSKLYRRLIICS